VAFAFCTMSDAPPAPQLTVKRRTPTQLPQEEVHLAPKFLRLKYWIQVSVVPCLVAIALGIYFTPLRYILFGPSATFYNAIADGDEMLVKWYLETGRVNAHSSVLGDQWDRPPLHIAADANQIGMVQLLLQRGAPVSEFDHVNHWTPLHYAAMNENSEMVDVLLKAGAHVNAVDHNGRSPLHVAAIKGSSATVQTLVFNGDADLDIVDADGMKAIGYGREFKNAEVVGLLESSQKEYSRSYDYDIPVPKKKTKVHVKAKKNSAGKSEYSA